MFLVIEVIMLAIGLSLLSSGRLPRWLLRRAKRTPTRASVRGLGALLVLPFPIAFLSGFALQARLGDRGTLYATALEIAVLAAATIGALLVFQRIRRQARGRGTGGTER
jgi:hypothetical protein